MQFPLSNMSPLEKSLSRKRFWFNQFALNGFPIRIQSVDQAATLLDVTFAREPLDFIQKLLHRRYTEVSECTTQFVS